MKIRLATEGKSITVDLNQEQAGKAFNDLTLRLIKYCELEPVIHKKEELPKAKPTENGEYSYKGFIYIRCPECGEIRGTCYKNERSSYRCQTCGNDIPFTKPLVPLYVRCQCGKPSKYLTNMTEDIFDINCIECGNPVAVQYNDRKNIYETIC